ncbi:MAG: hypothetical protein ABW033_08870 [Acidimicrobiia bacterium]
MKPAAPVLVLAIAALLLVGCVGRASFDDDVTFSDVEQVLTHGTLDVCEQSRHPDGLANQATATRTYEIALDCSTDDSVRLVVDEFDDAEARDGAARQFEGLLRPRGDGTVWTWGPFTLFANGGRDDAVMDRITDALDEAGAR